MNETKQNQTANLNIIHNKKIPKVSLIEPTSSGYLLFALEVDHRPPITTISHKALSHFTYTLNN